MFNIVITALAVFFFLSAVGGAMAKRRLEAEKIELAGKLYDSTAAHDRAVGNVWAALVPLKWALDLNDAGRDVRAVRLSLAQVFVNLQAAVDADDKELAEELERWPAPPVRWPKYPQLPPYLATADDVATRGAGAVERQPGRPDMPVTGADL